MAASRTTQADLLRTVYMPRMRVQFNLKRILLQILQRNEENYAEGEQLSVPLHAARTGGYGWSGAGALPVAGNQEPARANFNYKRMYGRIEITGPHSEGASKSYAAEARPYDFETQAIVEQMAESFNFDLFGSGNGALTGFAAQDIADTGATRDFVCASIKGLHKNQVVDLALTADGVTDANAVNCVITAIDVPNKTITLNNLVSWDETAFEAAETTYSLFRSLGTTVSTGVSTGFNQVCEGLLSACGIAGTYGGINRATAGNEYWKGQVNNGTSNSAPTESVIQQGIDLVNINSNGAVDLIVTTHAIWSHLAKINVDKNRYPGGTMKLNGWCDAIEVAGVPIVRDKHCPDAHIFWLDTSTLSLYQNDEGKWMDQDGAILNRILNTHAYEAAWFRFVQLVCDQPAANCIGNDYSIAYAT